MYAEQKEVNTGHTQKNGAVYMVYSLLIPHHSFVYALYTHMKQHTEFWQNRNYQHYVCQRVLVFTP
jgi:hypothetical protein